MRGTWLVAALSLAASGCAFTPQAVMLNPNLDAPASSVGKGRSVAVNVVDERPKTTLGTRGVRGIGADITLKNDLPQVVQASVSDGLRKQGFTVVPEHAADGREMRVEIRALEYEVTSGFWSGSLRTGCTLKGACIIGTTRPYEQVYRAEFQESIQVVQGDEANEKYINDVLSKALYGLLNDSRLSQCLAK